MFRGIRMKNLEEKLEHAKGCVGVKISSEQIAKLVREDRETR
jgi:hypothetical protein